VVTQNTPPLDAIASANFLIDLLTKLMNFANHSAIPKLNQEIRQSSQNG
jgi:hypothetical protein